ncbi:beta-galactosidase [Dyella sp. OK004]|uniref:glycoside hydrolase family 35 protein n=1 Tax=Dyella sp. OK004 TaxID=1855292 RepID=UPI0008E31E57|nr:beta-galactosidase family protein [Dyella sp. OK004]SFR94845.1 beta-galactosidase [Dyella sp. OK004]
MSSASSVFPRPTTRRLLHAAASLSLALACTASFADAPAVSTAAHTMRIDHGSFMLDGKPFRIISGDMHYLRIPREYWPARLKMAKAMGLNTITTYVFWNAHEATPGTYDFSGQNDVAEFIREAQKEGLYVILRPGPYVCSEWELGGLPAWLLKDKPAKLRTLDPAFMQPTQRWLHRLGQELAPLQLANGGNIIAVQVENEYASFGEDHAYLDQIRQLLMQSGFDKSLLFTSDNTDPGKNGLTDLLQVINFGTGNAEKKFAEFEKRQPQGPYMAGEYWAGWFDHWGAPHQTGDAKVEASEVSWMLKRGYSVNLYMFHGGTSFGWMNGANWDKDNYQPDVTSYDYDAPLNESGRPTPKYYAMRKAIADATGVKPPAIPATPGTQAIDGIKLGESASFWDNLPVPVSAPEPRAMEDLDQSYGYILYRKVIAADRPGDLVIHGLHDYAAVYVNQTLAGTLDRRLKQDTLAIKVAKGDTLDILVENTGRINFSTEMLKERKGILGEVALRGETLHDWKIYSLPLAHIDGFAYSNKPCRRGPCFYRGSFNAPVAGHASADTFLDTAGLNKGFVWLNKRPLGRSWKIGPQRTLYVPGAWLKNQGNQLVVFDMFGTDHTTLRTVKQPILDAPPSEAAP